MFAKQVLWPYKMHLCVKVPTLCFKHFLGAAIFAWGHASVSGSSLANYCTFPNLIGNSGFHLHGAYHWPQQKDYASCTSYEKKIIINFILFFNFHINFSEQYVCVYFKCSFQKEKEKKKNHILSVHLCPNSLFSWHWKYKTFPPWNTKCFTNAQVEDFVSEQTRVLKPFDHWHFHAISSHL